MAPHEPEPHDASQRRTTRALRSAAVAVVSIFAFVFVGFAIPAHAQKGDYSGNISGEGSAIQGSVSIRIGGSAAGGGDSGNTGGAGGATSSNGTGAVSNGGATKPAKPAAPGSANTVAPGKSAGSHSQGATPGAKTTGSAKRQAPGQKRAGKSGVGKSRASQSRVGKSQIGKSRAGKSQVGKSRAGKTGKSRAGKSRIGKSRAGKSRAGRSRAGMSRAGQYRQGARAKNPTRQPGKKAAASKPKRPKAAVNRVTASGAATSATTSNSASGDPGMNITIPISMMIDGSEVVELSPPTGDVIAKKNLYAAVAAAPQSKTFSAGGGQVTVNLEPASFEWDWGDGHNDTTGSEQAEHVYREVGQHRVTCRVYWQGTWEFVGAGGSLSGVVEGNIYTDAESRSFKVKYAAAYR